jgi:hypothetical protein
MYRQSRVARLWREGVAALYYPRVQPYREDFRLETHGPLGTIWVGIALICFYIALTWVNLLLGHFLTPLFIIPLTWVMDALNLRKADATPNEKNVGA